MYLFGWYNWLFFGVGYMCGVGGYLDNGVGVV